MDQDRSAYGRGRLVWLSEEGRECVARLVINLPRGDDGRRHRRSFTLRGSRREIERQRTSILYKLQKHPDEFLSKQEKRPAEMSAQTPLGVYLDHWINRQMKRLSERTTTNRRQYVEYYIQPHLGHVPLGRLKGEQIQRFYDQLEKSGRLHRRPEQPAGLTRTTISNLHRVLHAALHQAVRSGYIAANPADAVSVPKPERREPNILCAEQAARLLQAIDEPKLYLVVLMGITTGMRRAEILGLKWADVNLDRSLLTIRHALVDTGKRLVEKEPKTESSVRPLPIPGVLQEALRAHRAKQEAQRALLGPAYKDHDLVVCWEDGRPLHPGRLYRPLQRIVDRLGLPAVRLHDLRHSHATHLLQAGIHPKVVSERLGHRDVTTTLNVYTHVLPHIQQEAADATDRAIRSALERSLKTKDNEKP